MSDAIKDPRDLYRVLSRHAEHELSVKNFIKGVDLALICLTCNNYVLKVWSSNQSPKILDTKKWMKLDI